jgi:hypothetical protein
MKLLNAIYVSPVELLDKARRDGQALTQALSICDESAVRDSLFNFAISAYHLLNLSFSEHWGEVCFGLCGGECLPIRYSPPAERQAA